ncbi:MAG: hypothetical protein LBD17_06365 [Endomicrobium sp.]|jgi:hypothetical protein|nr:hypothetical protein [Endomicrobium sp.]
MNQKLILFLASLTFLFTADSLLAQPMIVARSCKHFPRPLRKALPLQVGGVYEAQSGEPISYGILYKKGLCIGFTRVYDKESLPKGCPNGYTTYDLEHYKYYLLAYNGLHIFNNKEEVYKKLAEIYKGKRIDKLKEEINTF